MELFAYGVLHRASARDRYEHSVSYMRRQGELTWMLMRTHPEGSDELMNESYMLSKRALSVLDDVKHTFDRSSSVSVLDLRRIMGQVKDTLHSYFEVLADVAAKQDVSRQTRQRNDFAFRQTIRNLIAAGFALNAALSLAAVVFWIRGVTNKVDLLVDDAHRIGKGQDLLPLQGGDDELADLERVLHEVNTRLKCVDEERREFTALISHELRSPLTAISGTLALAQEGVFGQVDGADGAKLRAAAISAKHLLNLINELLDVHKMEAGKSILKLGDCSLKELIEVAAAEVEDLARPKHVSIKLDVTDIRARLDVERIGQVLSKLLANSIERSPSGGTVVLSADESGGALQLNIIDEGAALALGQDPFEKRAPSRAGDVGPGLAICKGIINQHCGEIGARNLDNGSVCFWLELPLQAPGD